MLHSTIMISHWILATRIKTLPVSLMPVLLGLSLSAKAPTYSHGVSAVIIITVLCIQIATNLANDYYDFVKGADTHDRVGPKRMTHEGHITPTVMKRTSFILFGVSLVGAGLLTIVGGWPILAIGLLAVLFGWLYTGGPLPLAYIGGAEIVAFLFFGPVSVIGTVYLQTGQWVWELAKIGSGIGLIVAAILVVNNTRDIDTDQQANKKTWAVRFGRTASYIEYIALIYAPIFILDMLTDDHAVQMGLVLLLVFFGMILTRRFGRSTPVQMNRLLGLTSLYLMLYTSIAIYLLS